jgi:Vacuolar protein sorting-associated protein
MLKTQIFDTLKKYIGDYLYGFNQDQLKLGLLNGNIKLKNLTFKPDKINENLTLMRAPVLLKAGLIGNITIEVYYLCRVI